ncbi:MAG: sigma-70 family RNA polymerase sigma factor [Saprospiraceae bacterium]|nr:sigma-70 family RNA polymerase sigma factor [Saprospiraceae bacterium]
MLRFLRPKSNPPQSDEALLSAYQSGGDVELLGQLYERYVELTYGVCLKYLKKEADAEDAVMAIFEQLIEKARTHEVQNFRSWLYVLAKNYCLMQLRKPQREFSQSDFMHLNGISHPEEERPEEQEAQLRDCVEQLVAEQRSSIELFYFNEKSYQEIAEEKNEDLGKIRSYIQNGRRNLKICMEKKMVTRGLRD